MSYYPTYDVLLSQLLLIIIHIILLIRIPMKTLERLVTPLGAFCGLFWRTVPFSFLENFPENSLRLPFLLLFLLLLLLLFLLLHLLLLLLPDTAGVTASVVNPG